MTPTPDQVIANIREALEAGPTPGEWCAGDKWIFVSPTSGVPTDALENVLRDRPADEIDDDVSFIAAVNPQNIAVLLAELDSLRANIARLTPNPADHRYWEGRYRDAEAERDALRKALAQARNAALEEAAKLAEADFRSDLTRKAGHIPSWLEHGRRIAAAIRTLLSGDNHDR